MKDVRVLNERFLISNLTEVGFKRRHKPCDLFPPGILASFDPSNGRWLIDFDKLEFFYLSRDNWLNVRHLNWPKVTVEEARKWAKENSHKFTSKKFGL